MASKGLIPLGLGVALLATWAMLPQSGAQEPAASQRPFYQQVFGLGSQNQTTAKNAEKTGTADPVEPPAGIPLKKPTAIPLARRSTPPASAVSADRAANKAKENGAAPDRESVQKAIDLINRTYRADEGSSRTGDQPTDLERQMLAPFLPGASQTKSKENSGRMAPDGGGRPSTAPYGQGTIQLDEPAGDPPALQEKVKHTNAAAGSWFGQAKAVKTGTVPKPSPIDSPTQNARMEGNAARASDSPAIKVENQRPTPKAPILTTAPGDWQAMPGPVPHANPAANAGTLATQYKTAEGKTGPRKAEQARAHAADPAKKGSNSVASSFFFPSRWFGPARKQEETAQAHLLASGTAPRRVEFASEPLVRPANGSGVTQVSLETAAFNVPAAFPGERPGPTQPAPGRSQYNESFPESSGEGPELPQPYPSSVRQPSVRQPLPRGSVSAPPSGSAGTSGNPTGSPSTRTAKPSLSGRGDLLPFPAAQDHESDQNGSASSSGNGYRGTSYPGNGFPGGPETMRVPPGGFAESEMATEPDASLELPAPRLANSPEAKIRGLIQAHADERQRLASPKQGPTTLKDAGLDENQRLKWRIELAMEKVMAQKNRAPGYDAARDGNPTGPVGVDLWERARSYYDRGDFVAAMETLRALEKTETRGELILPARFLLASCLVQSGRHDDASKILRELAATPNDRVIADLAQWRLSQIRSRIQLEKTLEEVRAKSLRLTEIQN